VDFVGERVRRGQPLFDIYSPELVTAQEEYLLALEQFRRLGESDFPQVREAARRLLTASRTRLAYWDVSAAQIERIAAEGRVRKAITVYSPASGVVIRKNALLGHYVKAGEHQYEIADLSRVWVDVEIYEYELPWVRQGMEAVMDLAYIPGARFEGRVLFIYPYLNPKTRTATLRLEFANTDERLKPDMFTNVYLESRLGEDVLVVPQEAVIDSGVRKLVFVSRGQGKFTPREVKIGAEVNQGELQVLEGLSAGEEIVISAQFMLDSESSLREAIQKMLEVRKGGAAAADELDLSGVTMESDELDMQGLTMDEPPPDAGPKSQGSGKRP
jgi:Cu(I)/Ag(I) efflux system membrane fusion protein/cobalt-zinc-cadmium efflux system membrane fusion protein